MIFARFHSADPSALLEHVVETSCELSTVLLSEHASLRTLTIGWCGLGNIPAKTSKTVLEYLSQEHVIDNSSFTHTRVASELSKAAGKRMSEVCVRCSALQSLRLSISHPSTLRMGQNLEPQHQCSLTFPSSVNEVSDLPWPSWMSSLRSALPGFHGP